MWSAPEAPEYNQWALNPSAYQDLSHEEIDWALLAQQWIKMKETCPKDQVPPAPPPPPLGPRRDETHDDRIENEGGEAPMDMETREESLGDDAPHWGSYNNWNNQCNNWHEWNAGGRVGPPPGVPPGAPPGGPPYNFGPDSQGFNDGPPPGTIDYNHGNSEHFPPDEKINHRVGMPNHGRLAGKHLDGPHHFPPGHPGQNSGPGYWSSGDGPHLGPYTKHNRNLWKHGAPRPPRDRFGREEKPKEEVEEEDTVETLDAAKRRHLPAWIRDGLEKMEREKQKKLDRERQLKEREVRLEQQRLEDEQEAAAVAAGAMPKKSKFESDSDSESESKGAVPGEGRKSRFQSVHSPSGSPARSSRARSPSIEKDPPKSREEIMQQVMMKVRQMLTLILLEVTNEEMRNIAEETFSRARMKAPATDLQKTPALASLTGKLGLGIYEDSDEESGTDSDVDAAKQTNGADSDEDLQETIRRRKQDFMKIEREIEADLAEEEEKEKRLKGREEEEDDEDDEDDGDEPDEEGKNERGGGSKNQAQVEHQKAGSNLHLKEHGLQEASDDADNVDGEPANHASASRASPGRSPRDGSSSDRPGSSASTSSSSRVSGRRKRSKRSRDSWKKKDKKRKRSSSREDDKKSKRRDSVDSSRRGKSRSRSRSDSGYDRSRRDRKHRDSSRESSRRDRSGHRDRGRDRDRYYRDRDRDSRRRRGGSRRRSSSRGRSRSRSRRTDSRSRRSSSRTRSHRRSRSRSRRSRSVDSRRRRDSSGSRSLSPSKSRRRRSRSRSRSHHKSSRRRHSSEGSSERSSGKKSRRRRRD